MSVKKPQLIFVLVLLIGFGIYQNLKPKASVRQSFASQINVSEYSSRGIVDRIIRLEIKTENDSEVTASVSLPFDFDQQLHYKWTLGQNIILKEGSLEGVTEKGFSKDQKKAVKISVQGFSKDELRHIGFEVWGDKNGRRIYTDGLISSQKENSFEDIVQHVEKIKAEKSGIQK